MPKVQTILGGRYRLVDNIIKSDRTGNAALWTAEDLTSFVYAKIWPRLAAHDSDLKAIWNHEVRSLLRLNGYPRATEYFAQVREAAADDSGYYLILDVGTRQLLGPLLANRSRHAWLRGLTTIGARQKLWDGLRRVATALTILHSEGTLHRTLDPDAVFADLEGAGDFRLSGFEWSLRLSAAGASRKRRGSDKRGRIRPPELDRTNAQFSFASDWFDFGLLATEVVSGLPVTMDRTKGIERLREDIKLHHHLSIRERTLLLDLMEPAAESRLRLGTDVLQAISDATSAQRQRVLARPQSALYLGVSLAVGSLLTRAIVEASNKKIKPTEFDRQRTFIEDDLSGDVEVVWRTERAEHYIVHGRRLSYRVQQWTMRGNQKTWDVGFCGLPDVSASRPNDVTYTTQQRPIHVRLFSDVRPNLHKIRQNAIPWNTAFPPIDTEDILDPQQKIAHDFFRVTNQLDAVLTAAQIWPVEVVDADVAGGRVTVSVTPVDEPAREELAHYLELHTPALQMQSVFADDRTQDQRSAEAEYILEDEGVLGRSDRETNIAWRFDAVEDVPSGRRYTFFHEDPTGYCPSGIVYLSPRDLSGSSAQLRRRHRAIEAMRNHATLLSTIADPSITKRNTHEEPGLTPEIEDLDDSKQLALENIWKSQPIYTLQGPPGTGKTELVRTLIHRLLEIDSAQQVLVTAHSHDAVDHIHEKVESLSSGAGSEARVLVRLDDEGARGAAQTALRIGQSVARSPLSQTCPEHIKKRLDLISSSEMIGSDEARGFQALVRQAANVIFATSNSRELARLLEDNRRFDWSIMEEAGKAHGFDLAMALQASHRLLMIGDQRQLPPFNVRQLEKLLAEPARVLGALKTGIEFAPSFVDRSLVEELSETPEAFASLCEQWRRMVKLFGALYDLCEETNQDGQLISSRLDQQHRMHPIIADLIRDCFYPDGLETAPKARAKFEEKPDGFEVSEGGWLPPHRIIFVDIPWVQKAKQARGEEGGTGRGRRYTSRYEADVVVRTLSALRAKTDSEPEIQVLSPYRAQVELIRNRILEDRASGKLPNLDGFRFVGEPDEKLAGAGTEKIGATVDEFQGNEADVIIISLVRNNALPAGSGVGFLGEEPRVNVLLSRAKRKLVLVGSWDFFASRVPPSRYDDKEYELAHIHRIMTYLDEAVERGEAERISADKTYMCAP